jgi:acyl-coenzyme A thioesterase PaaI-like protein
VNQYEMTCRELKERHHAACLFNDAADGLCGGLRTWFNERGHLLGEFPCDARLGGYDGMVHGGILAAVADAAMAQCLMGHGIVAYTARLELRYRQPVVLGEELAVRCRIIEETLGLVYHVRADLRQRRSCCVTAKGTFRRVDGDSGYRAPMAAAEGVGGAVAS